MAKDPLEFFLVTLPGLEDLALSEVQEWFPHFESKMGHGGITVLAPLEEGLSMNMALKIPTRILIRISQFTCKDFPKLFNKVLDFSWQKWIDPSCQIKAHASVTASRLKIKKRIEETCEKAFAKYQKNAKIKPSPNTIDLFIRLNDNHCTLSLDTSGERLHKRGLREFIGEAPLRETIAAALIQMVGRHADKKMPIEVIDPMMGSGVFLLEAAFRDEVLEERDFAFGNFIRQPEKKPSLSSQRAPIEGLYGFEQDQKTLKAAEKNLKSANIQIKTNLNFKDFFQAEPIASNKDKQRWVLVNPPYGERIKVEEPLGPFYAKLFANTERVAKPDYACFLLPSKAASGRLVLPPTWRVLEKRSFSNGGIPVLAFVFGRK